MGYSKSRKLFKLVMQLDDDEDAIPLMITVEAMRLGDVKSFIDRYPDTSEGRWARSEYEQKEFISRVKEWNLDDDEGNSAPVSVSSLDTFLELPDVSAIIRTWLARCLGTDVDPPLKKQSDDGQTMDPIRNLEESLPMETL